jgi:sugar O-acyltransferase (sialic acid O-acetyltransferase NeuD family)
MDKSIILYGSRLLARLIVEDSILTKSNNIAGVLLDDEYHFDTLIETCLIRKNDLLKNFPPSEFDFIVLDTAQKRSLNITQNDFPEENYLSEEILKLGYNLSNYISKKANLSSSAAIGKNNVILYGSFIGPGVTIGNNNIIREMVYVGHDSEIGDSNFFASQATIGGRCKIEGFSFVGLNSTIINSVNISNHSNIGAGAVIIKDTKKYGKYVGNPGKNLNEDHN